MALSERSCLAAERERVLVFVQGEEPGLGPAGLSEGGGGCLGRGLRTPRGMSLGDKALLGPGSNLSSEPALLHTSL